MRRGDAGGNGLLDLWEPGWQLGFTDPDGAGWISEIEDAVWRGAAADLGAAALRLGVDEVARRWPGCLVVAVARCFAGAPRGTWTVWHRVCGVRAAVIHDASWESALLRAARSLGIAGAASADAVVRLLAPVPDAPGGEHGERVRLDPYGRGLLRGPDPDAEQIGPQDLTQGAEGSRPLVFDEAGRLLAGDLPPEPVWVLHPADAELTADRELRVLVTSRMPLGWHGWRLAQVDLGPVGRLGVAGAEPRRVRGAARPRLEHRTPPVPGLRTDGGLPLYAEPPSVRLPSGPGIRWRIEVRHASGGPVLAATTATTASTASRTVDPWSRLPRPLLGEYTVTAAAHTPSAQSRPEGGLAVHGLRRAIAIAQDIQMRCSPALRLPTESGLEPGEALLGGAPGITLSPLAAELGPLRTEATVRAVSGSTVLVVHVCPPHLRIRIEPEPGTVQPAHARTAQLARGHWRGPLVLRTADLARGGSLRLDLPAQRSGQEPRPPISVRADGIEVQVLEPSKVGRYPLRRLLDTVGVHAQAGQGLHLIARLDGREALLAVIEPDDPAEDPWRPDGGG